MVRCQRFNTAMQQRQGASSSIQQRVESDSNSFTDPPIGIRTHSDRRPCESADRQDNAGSGHRALVDLSRMPPLPPASGVEPRHRPPSRDRRPCWRCKGSLLFRDCNKLQPQLRTKNRQHSCNRRERALWPQSSFLSSGLSGTQNGTFGIRRTRNNGLRACPCDTQVSRIYI